MPSTLGIAAEAALPEAVAQDDDVEVGAARAVERDHVLAVAERAAEERLDAEHAEQIGGDARAEHALGLLRAGEIEIGDVRGRARSLRTRAGDRASRGAARR